ncbi:MAG: hypothetical protein K6U80_11890 [Firmicutes bacterium]|nr:hypothetical protein [Bacillota bacterium]
MKKYCLLLVSLLMVVSLCGYVFADSNDVKPTLTLKVEVITTSTTGESVVLYTAKLSPVTSTTNPPIIDFYTGSPYLTVYPNIYLGSAPVDNTGTAMLKVIQRPGKYAGGAIWKSPLGPIFAPVVIYSVP